jgi:hypothetical protein
MAEFFATSKLKGKFYKQGRIIKNWKERIFELQGLVRPPSFSLRSPSSRLTAAQELAYYDPVSKASKGRVELIPGQTAVLIPADGKYPTKCPLEIRVPGRRFLIATEDTDQRRDLMKVVKAKTHPDLDRFKVRVAEGTALYQTIVTKMQARCDPCVTRCGWCSRRGAGVVRPGWARHPQPHARCVAAGRVAVVAVSAAGTRSGHGVGEGRWWWIYG